MLRTSTAAALLVAGALGAGTALAQAPAPPATPAPTPATPAPDAAPAIASLRVPKVVTAQQGHARLLVGVRLATPARLSIQISAVKGDRVVRTIADTEDRRAGRSYLRIDAIDQQGYQLLRGAYRVRVQASDEQGRLSRALQATVRLRLTAPRGQFDAYTIPLWRAFRRQAGTTADGQLVAVVAPKGAVAAAGIRRGDVVTSLNGAPVGSPGAWSAALRALPAGKEVAVAFVRGGAERTATLTPKPDWEQAPDYARALTVAVRREPRTVAYAVARARQMVEAGKHAPAARLVAAWPRSWRTSAPGQLVQGEIEAARERWKQALGAYNRARKKDPRLAAAEFGRGVALSSLKKDRPSRIAFAAAGRLDPADAAAAGFEAYALLREDRVPDAVAAASRAVRLDNRYADAFLPLGMALLADGQKAQGVRMLRRGLLLLEDAERAARLTTEHLDPTDP
ncbi:PDZ domain-containing protein [Miltoncostaea marina]|uniref:PDZ domain-containing protein n=1 Tax=Miltoncostaea marina TaxID=2843215 RepID=UPI001C3D2962|nr:S1C family serine protease [Miltoncostaea marina]